MKKNYNWAILGCGVIANELANAFASMDRHLYGVANRTHDKAAAFGAKYGVEVVYDSIEEMFLDENVDVIYISTPHNTHLPFLLEALGHGKHVLCEKAITLNAEELKEAMDAAQKHGVILAEAMTIYHMPVYKELGRRVASGEFGAVRMIQMNFGSYKEYNMENRFFNRNLAGGALLDIGVYAISFVRYFMGKKPNQICTQVKYAPSAVDEQVGILLMNELQEMSTIALTLHAKQPKRGVISCDKAYIEVETYPRAKEAVITYTDTGKKETIQMGETENALLYEVKDMEKAIVGEENEMHLDYTEDVMDIMTTIRRQWGMTYPEEEEGNRKKKK